MLNGSWMYRGEEQCFKFKTNLSLHYCYYHVAFWESVLCSLHSPKIYSVINIILTSWFCYLYLSSAENASFKHHVQYFTLQRLRPLVSSILSKNSSPWVVYPATLKFLINILALSIKSRMLRWFSILMLVTKFNNLNSIFRKLMVERESQLLQVAL